MFTYLSQLSVTMWKNHACDPLHRTRGRFRARHIHVRELLDSALTSTKSRRQVSYPWIAYRVWILLKARIKGCAGCCAKPLRRKVQKFQYIKCSLSPRRRGTKRRFRKHLRRGGGRNVVERGWRRNNDNPSRCTSISSRRMPHIFADTNDATSRTNTCLVVLRSSVTRSPLLSYLGIPSLFSFFFLLPPSMNEIIPFL